ncbi:MAG: protein phosphatase 2C domain-containing protein [Oscillospiraceae bacterium]|nr:protein phosphatase 2C domain-containing protein [Oscillospiraceae bacterium]
MIGYYSLSLQGKSHVSGSIPCQDSSLTMLLANGWAIAVIADGLGSAKRSDAGSFLAVNGIVKYMTEKCPKKWAVPKIKQALQGAFELANDFVVKKSATEGNNIGEYDTTLTVAIFNGSQVVYGHVGDGGIITLSNNGEFKMLTKAQKGGGEFNMVSPLRSKEKWVFGHSDTDVCAITLLTDGIYDVICPWILAEQKQPVYVNYIRPFMDRNILKVNAMKDFDKVRREVKDFLNSEYNANITDDKTIATVINLDVLPKIKPAAYYAEPDWAGLQNENRKKLYSAN